VAVQAADDAEDIRDLLASATEAALTKDGFDDVVERLVDADRNRLGKAMPKEEQLRTLNGRVDHIRKAWRDKYGEDFDINNEEAVFTRQFVGIAQGEIQDPQVVSRNWPVRPTQQRAQGLAADRPVDAADPAAADPARPDDAAQPAGARRGRDGAPEDGAAQQRILEKGRDVGLVRLADSHGLPGLTVSLIQENPDMWRIDMPDSLNAQRLHDNLLKHLTQVGEHSAHWPADKNEAFRQVSHHVLMALLDVDASTSEEPRRIDGQRGRASDGDRPAAAD
jgi:hypothetical protein